jgi:hypothetical protein
VLHACSVIYVSFKRVKRWEHWYQRLPYTAHVAELVTVVHSAQAAHRLGVLQLHSPQGMLLSTAGFERIATNLHSLSARSRLSSCRRRTRRT